MPVTFHCGNLTLEGEWHFPGGDGPFPVVVVCHPYPPGGGTMHNNVVLAICDALQKRSVAAFGFNFRGVGNSEGSFADGIGEREDVRAALDYVFYDPRIDNEKVGLAGYSFGAMVSLPVALNDERVKMLALVSAPLSDGGWEHFKDYGKPKLYIIGDADQMLPVEQFREKVKDAADPEQYREIPGADHFMVGYEAEPARLVAEFFADGLAG